MKARGLRESFLQASKFVGRKAELDQLKAYLQKVMTGETAFIVMGGESGVGKSRLVDELQTQALVKGAITLRAQAGAEGGSSFQLWRGPIRRLVLSTSLSDLEASILRDLVPDIGDLLEREVNLAPEIVGSAWQERMVFTLVDVFKRQTKSLVLILEDLHWATEGLSVLKQMLKVREQLPHLLVIGKFRDDEKPELMTEFSAMQSLSLKRLNTVAISDLSEAMLGEAGRQPQVVELLQRETEGNAFFMVEVVCALAEGAGSLAEIGRTTLPMQISAGGIQQVVQRRLNRLLETIQTWLKPIAVAGRQLDLSLVDRLHMDFAAQRDEYLTMCANFAVLDVVGG